MLNLSPTMIGLLKQFADGKPRSCENGLFNARYPTLHALWMRDLIRPERNDRTQRIWAMRFIITERGKTELQKRVKP